MRYLPCYTRNQPHRKRGCWMVRAVSRVKLGAVGLVSRRINFNLIIVTSQLFRPSTQIRRSHTNRPNSLGERPRTAILAHQVPNSQNKQWPRKKHTSEDPVEKVARDLQHGSDQGLALTIACRKPIRETPQRR